MIFLNLKSFMEASPTEALFHTDFLNDNLFYMQIFTEKLTANYSCVIINCNFQNQVESMEFLTADINRITRH